MHVHINATSLPVGLSSNWTAALKRQNYRSACSERRTGFMEATSARLTKSDAEEWASVAGHAPGLSGLSGRILLRVGDTAVGILQIQESGNVAVIKGEDAHTVCLIDTHETLIAMLAGERDPIVDLLQGRVRTEGDHVFALRVRFGLQAGSPWKSVRTGS